jgi:hypothetical protein
MGGHLLLGPTRCDSRDTVTCEGLSCHKLASSSSPSSWDWKHSIGWSYNDLGSKSSLAGCGPGQDLLSVPQFAHL